MPDSDKDKQFRKACDTAIKRLISKCYRFEAAISRTRELENLILSHGCDSDLDTCARRCHSNAFWAHQEARAILARRR